MKGINQTIAGGVVAALLAVPAFGQSKLNMNDCSKIVATHQAACKADNDLRTQCNATRNPIPCYNAKKAAASNTTTATTAQKPVPAPAPMAAPKPTPAPVAAKPAAPIAAPAPTNSSMVTSVPPGARNCATDGKTCQVAGNWTGVYGANNKYASISGSGDFICLPGTFKINDPVPGVLKTCWIIGAAPAPVAAKPAAPIAVPAPGSTDTNMLTSVPQGARNCATDGKKCQVAGNWTGVYGANNKYAKISGSGDFICLPGTFKIGDPVPGVMKTCWVIGAAPAAAPAATAPVATAQPKVSALPLSCKGGLVNSPTKTFTSQGDFSKWYGSADAMAATSLEGATTECRTSCAKTGEPAPCGWYTLVRWREDSSATGKSRMVYTCYKVNARNYKDAFKPTMATDKNFGNASNGLFFGEAYTYPCAR